MFTNEDFADLKEKYLETLVSGTIEAGGLPPHLTLFGNHKEETETEKAAIIHIPIPDKFMQSEDGKDEFIDKLIPMISEKVKEKFVINAVAWASEAWFREQPKGEPVPENYKDLPIKKEIIMVNIESILGSSLTVYEMIRNGQKVNSDGELIDNVELVIIDTDAPESVGGRFTGLLKLFI